MALTGEENNSLVFNITKDTRLRWFQYRIFQIILPTNRFLFDTKQLSSPICSFCNESVENYLHLFYYCSLLVFRKVVRMEKSRH